MLVMDSIVYNFIGTSILHVQDVISGKSDLGTGPFALMVIFTVFALGGMIYLVRMIRKELDKIK